MIGGFFVPTNFVLNVPSPSRAGSLLQFGMHSPVGVSLLAMNDNEVSGLRINPIQRPVNRQFGQHDDLLNRQRRITLGPAQLIGKVTG